jgi:hypothetical protein
MVSGFLGTLISLERAVALEQNRHGSGLSYLAPLFAGLGTVALFFDFPTAVPRSLAVLGALGLTLMFARIYRLQPTLDHGVMGLGALLWLAGNALWLAGWPIFRVVPWWAGFLVLTIAGERLELSRVLRPSQTARRSFVVIIALFILGLLWSLFASGAGIRLCGVSLLFLGLWLLRHDIARRTIRGTGLPRYIAACLLPGYLWLVISGGLWLWYGATYAAGPVYDALLHTIFVGFVFSMIFGHAPIIVPALLGLKVPYTPLFYGPLLLLHSSLILRVAGDLLPWLAARRWGGMLNEVAILMFLLLTAVVVLHGHYRR